MATGETRGAVVYAKVDPKTGSFTTGILSGTVTAETSDSIINGSVVYTWQKVNNQVTLQVQEISSTITTTGPASFPLPVLLGVGPQHSHFYVRGNHDDNPVQLIGFISGNYISYYISETPFTTGANLTIYPHTIVYLQE